MDEGRLLGSRILGESPDSQVSAEEGADDEIGGSECARDSTTSLLRVKASDDSLEEAHAKPWFVGPVLLCAVLAVSSAGAVTKSMVGAAPITNAGWRLQVASIILLPGFLWQWLRLPRATRERTKELTNLTILSFSGVALALHFGLWVWSLDHTSLAHSLLFVSTPPIVLAVLACLQGQPLSRGELSGVALGMGGVLVIAAGSRVENDNDVTLLGDLVAFAAAIAFVVYISAGQHLRGWMPLYVYAFPVTAIAAFLLALGGIGLEGLEVSSTGEICGPFGWVRKEYWLPTLYLALGPGFVGHTGLNAVLRYLSSLIIAMAITLEPPLGTALGWLLGVSSAPGIWTCIGGVVLLLGTLWVNYASEQRKIKSSSKASTLGADNVHGDEDTDLLLDP